MPKNTCHPQEHSGEGLQNEHLKRDVVQHVAVISAYISQRHTGAGDISAVIHKLSVDAGLRGWKRGGLQASRQQIFAESAPFTRRPAIMIPYHFFYDRRHVNKKSAGAFRPLRGLLRQGREALFGLGGATGIVLSEVLTAKEQLEQDALCRSFSAGPRKGLQCAVSAQPSLCGWRACSHVLQTARPFKGE
eukprot:364867-Chlamydomonas_euryale.AAC.2